MTISKERTQVLNATRMAMADFAVMLERVIGEPVFDKTNLVALYGFTIDLPLNYTLRQSRMRGAAPLRTQPQRFTVRCIATADGVRWPEGSGAAVGETALPD